MADEIDGLRKELAGARNKALDEADKAIANYRPRETSLVLWNYKDGLRESVAALKS